MSPDVASTRAAAVPLAVALPLSDRSGHEAVPGSNARASINAGLGPCAAKHLLIASCASISAAARAGQSLDREAPRTGSGVAAPQRAANDPSLALALGTPPLASAQGSSRVFSEYASDPVEHRSILRAPSAVKPRSRPTRTWLTTACREAATASRPDARLGQENGTASG
jgi:hypothetical protein